MEALGIAALVLIALYFKQAKTAVASASGTGPNANPATTLVTPHTITQGGAVGSQPTVHTAIQPTGRLPLSPHPIFVPVSVGSVYPPATATASPTAKPIIARSPINSLPKSAPRTFSPTFVTPLFNSGKVLYSPGASGRSA
jgi:hypothetical protein